MALFHSHTRRHLINVDTYHISEQQMLRQQASENDQVMPQSQNTDQTRKRKRHKTITAT